MLTSVACVAVTVVPDELGAWLVQQRRWMNSANIMDLRQLFINLSWVNSKMRIFLYIIQLLRWVEFNAGLGICFGKAVLPPAPCLRPAAPWPLLLLPPVVCCLCDRFCMQLCMMLTIPVLILLAGCIDMCCAGVLQLGHCCIFCFDSHCRLY